MLWEGACQEFSAYPPTSDITGQGWHTSLVKTTLYQKIAQQIGSLLPKLKWTEWCHQLRWLLRSFCKIALASEFTQSCPVQTEPISPWRTNIQSLWTVSLGTDKFHSLLNCFWKTETGLRIERDGDTASQISLRRRHIFPVWDRPPDCCWN